MKFQSDYTLEEFAARRKKLCEQVGDALILIAGAPISNGSFPFKQYNDFYYLCGVEVPHSYLTIEASTGKTTLYLPEAQHLVHDSDDPLLCADDPEFARTTTGVDVVANRAALDQQLATAKTVYTFLVDGEDSRAAVRSLADARKQIEADPWDGRWSRGAHLCHKIKTKYPSIEIKDVQPIIYEMRMDKSPAEVKLLRRAAQLSAFGLVEAMKATRPGVMEYQVASVMFYHYFAGGSRDMAYPAIVGGGKNAFHGHYHANSSALLDGDMVLVDCAPDIRNYTSDITRMWPVNGRYSPAQRALYGYITEYHKTLLSAIRPGRTCDEIEDEAVEIMRERVKDFDFATKSHATGPEWMFNFRKHLAHSVGLSVHDGVSHKDKPLRPGVVFSVDPQMKIVEDRLYLRVEDTVLVTENGCDVLTKDAPLDLDAIETVMQQPSMLDQFPPMMPG